MSQSDPLKWDTPTLILSDLHLNGGERDRWIIDRLLVATGVSGRGVLINYSDRDDELDELDELRERDPQTTRVRRVVLLGDVFDFNLGYQTTIFRAHLPFLLALDRIRRAGVEVWVLSGNHDPELTPALAGELELNVSEGPISPEIYGVQSRLEHGDLRERSRLKRLLCWGARRPWICRLARLIPPALTWRITARLGTDEPVDPPATPPADQLTSQSTSRSSSQSTSQSTSEHQAQDRPPSISMSDDDHSLDHLLIEHWPSVSESGVECWVLGHFHRAVAWRERDETRPHLFVLGDQVRLNTCLYWDQRGPTLARSSVESSTLRLTPIKPSKY